MSGVQTFEGTVENGQIRLRDNVTLPNKAKVYVIVPEMAPERPLKIFSPRLVNPADAADFVKVVLEEEGDVRV